ncbi:cyclic nucleotide-binding protein [Flavobacterium sp. 316]|uniref:Crp/Fnr family transcriptional regulator n=1 Tax=Flavobacterium sediminilitoris TaxID=2024526 RepID=A0ABY4HJJ0_9FLAO|nr:MULTISPECIES: Crp/Fnr family transcriptional regulator [Flavobacterium]KIX22558.1 cyclic nucleotide-binding protein [Flavobacterium sp. 316]UOX32826.1 Crp/Fnr family transcriptional regulator [Flavobacterium sediminilitoris]
MTKQLYKHINQFIAFEEEHFSKVLSYFDQKELSKKEIIMKAGELCNYNYFVLEGCLHMYYINDKGIEKTVQFAIKNWWLSDYLALYNRQKTDFYIQAVQNTHILSIDYENQNELLIKFPSLEGYFRNIYQIAYGASIMRVKKHFDYSKEEIFFRFSEEFPEFIQQVPQYLIASFLGLTPEYVSEIRRKKRS